MSGGVAAAASEELKEKLKGQEEFFRQLLKIPENKECFDCGGTTSWASVPFGLFVCLTCASVHRSKGTHITFIRSIKLDSWSAKQLKYMELGGNLNAKNYFSSAGIMSTNIEEKYITKRALDYKQLLETKVNQAMSEITPSISVSTSTPTTNNQTSSQSVTPISIQSPTPTNNVKKSTSNNDIKNVEQKFKTQSLQDLDNNDFDNGFGGSISSNNTPSTHHTSSNNTPSTSSSTTTKKTVAKKMTLQSFDDDWDSIPDKPIETKPKSKRITNSSPSNKNYQDDDQDNNSKNKSNNEENEDSSDNIYKSSRFSMQSNKSTSSSNNNSKSSPPLSSSNNSSKSYSSNNSSSSKNNNNSNKNNNRDDDQDYARKNFSNAKSISSKQYYGEDKERVDPERQYKIQQFSGATSISSAQYYGRDETSEMNPVDYARNIVFNAKTDFSSISNTIVDGGKKLSNLASNFINDLQDRYN